MLIVAVAASLLILGACSSDKEDDGSSSTTQTTAKSSTDAETVKFDKSIQQQLKDVGCYSGAVDGILGPETDAAIVAFQTAAGLTADGQLGPETESALKSDASAKKQVCDTTST